jgi:hypothetical protein
MDEVNREKLLEMAQQATPEYSKTAKQLLSGEFVWPKAQIEQLIDAYLHDPFLMRNQ